MPPSEEPASGATAGVETKPQGGSPPDAGTADLKKVIERWVSTRFGARGLVVLALILFAAWIWWEWEHVAKLPGIESVVARHRQKSLPEEPAERSPEAARIQLSQMSLTFTSDNFYDSVKRRDVLAVKLFLAAGMSPDVGDITGVTPLMFVAAHGDVELVDLLLKAKADVNKKHSPDTALSFAAAAGKTDIARMLLDRGAQREIGKHFVAVAQTGNLEVLRILLDRGASLGEVGSEALMAAVDRSPVEGAQINFVTGKVSGPQDEMKYVDTVKFLLDHGVDSNVKDREGWTPLLVAARQGNVPAISLLLDRGADINVKCDCGEYAGGGWSALTVAIREGLLPYGHSIAPRYKNAVQALMVKGADVDSKNNRGQTAVMLAASQGDTDVIQALLDKGADVNGKSAKGGTPLMYAAVNGSADTVRVLLKRGARLDDKDIDGKTALQLAQEGLEGEKRAEIVKLLKKAEPR